MDPSSAEEWIEIARQRAADAAAMLPDRKQSIGPVYMAGYAVECALKAFLYRKNIRRPRTGPEGHNLQGLWKASGFRLRDLSDRKGFKASTSSSGRQTFATPPVWIPSSKRLISSPEPASFPAGSRSKSAGLGDPGHEP